MKLSLTSTARITGVSILLMSIVAGYAYGYVWPMFGGSEAQLSWMEQQQNASTFMMGVAAWLLIAVLDLIVSVAVCELFRVRKPRLASFTSASRLIYTIILFIGIMKLCSGMNALQLESGQIQLQNAMDEFQFYWSVGLIVFGIHLIGLGTLTKHVKWVSFLLYVAGACYVIVHGGLYLFPSLAGEIHAFEKFTSFPMAMGELIFALMLTFKPKHIIR